MLQELLALLNCLHI